MYFQALIWLIVLTNESLSAPVIAAISAFASTALGGIIVNAAIGLALSIGTSLLQSLIAKNSRSRDPGTTVQLRVGGANPLTFPLGRSATAGVRAYYGVWGAGKTPNEYMVDVLLLSALPVPGGVTRVWMNDQQVTIRTDLPKTEMGWPIEEYLKKGRYHAWFDFHDGTQTTANPYLLSKFGSDPNYPWTSDMIGRGVAYATITARWEKNGLWQSGYPNALFELESVPLYDIRKDSTAGGLGTHRWNDRATWEPSNNAMVRAYNVARGAFYYNDEWIYGGQNWPAHRLPASSWMAGMNACDVTIGGEPQFHGGGIIETDIEIATTLEELLRSSSGFIAEIGGAYKIRIGAPGAPVMGFNDSNIIVTREQGYTPFPGLESTYNIARITYTEPEERWSSKESPERRDTDAIAADDNRELPFSIELPWVTSNLTAQRIGKAALANGRRFKRHSMFHAPLFWLIEPLDVVAWTSAHNSYNSKPFDVEQISGSSSLLQSLVIREVDPADSVWNPVTDPLSYQVVPLVSTIVPPQVVTGWQAFPATIKDEAGRDRRPSVEVRFDGDATDIDRVRVQVRTSGVTDPFFDATVPYPETPVPIARMILNGDFPPNVAVEVRGMFIPFTDRDTDWSVWLPVTTPDVKLVAGLDFDPYEGVIGFDTLGDDLEGYQDWIGSGIRETERRLEEIDLWIADQDLGNAYDRQKIREQITATYDFNKAEWTYAVSVVATETTAIATRVETLTATVNDPTTGLAATATAVTQLDTEVTNLDGIVASYANAITSLSAATDPNNTTTANFRMSAVAGPSGYARIGAEGRTGGVGDWRSAGWYIDVPNNTALPTRFTVQADQFIVSSDASSIGVNPLVFEDGVLKLQVARIGTAIVEQFQTPSGKTRFGVLAPGVEGLEIFS